jgi:hypothetical protein
VDTLPVPDTRVVLHRVGRTRQGPLDSTRADGQGRFRFGVRPDSQAVFLLSARHAGIEHFSQPVVVRAGEPAVVTVIVSDTSSAAPVELESRYFLAGSPAADSPRVVLDVLVLRNASGVTRVADSGTATWSVGGIIPLARIEDGTDFSRDAMTLRGDSLLVFAPIPPGQRQIVLSYRLPRGTNRLEVPMGVATRSLAVLAEEPTISVDGSRLREGAPERIDQSAIRRWVGSARPGDVVRFRFSQPGRASPPVLLVGLVVVVSAALIAGLVLAGRPRGRPAPAATGGSSEADLLDELARLDLRYKGREADPASEEWAAYQAERAELKRRLAAALAARRPEV